jgi:prepilin-type N-terminal cleavage/methylation domain-containing protein
MKGICCQLRTCRRYRQQGMTLVEVMIAVLLLASIAVLMGTLFPMASRTQKTVSGDTFAITLARNKLEQTQSLGYANLASHDTLYQRGVVDAWPADSPYSFTSTDGVSDELLGGTGTLWIEEHSEDSDLYRIKVRISWTDSRGESRSIYAATEVANVD